MKVYAQLYIRDHRGLVEALGSFSVCVIDAKLDIHNMIEIGRELAERESKVKPIAGFAIVRSNKFIDTLDLSNSNSVLYRKIY